MKSLIFIKNQLLKTKWKINKTLKLIKLINSKNTKGLYALSSEQVNSILDLRLQKLTGLERDKIVDEAKEKATKKEVRE